MTDSPKSERKDDRLWGGRFEREPDKAFDAFQRSFSFDRRLLPFELAVDRVWAGALVSAGILSNEELREMLTAIDKIAERAANDPSWMDNSPAEDIHHFVEMALVEYLGPLGF